ncbi:hypothetical protein IAR55_001164 [Kwoniella newhampshirensis]|uniref:GATA-type domain-containing protein n=1 Tax=Kwoniella newhampshirensis TaxID=1651941 RepID=A0AAW0Z575_9TREE
MASLRALLRTAGFQPIPLPSSSRPQFVNEEGFEYDPEELVEAVSEAGDDIEDGGEEVEEVDEVVEVDEDVVMDQEGEEGGEGAEAEGDEQEEAEQAPLLSVAESLVLPYSLTQTRHHHLTSLLPHIFTHPPIPSHSKPRARPPPKGTFLFPTPPPLAHPLPSKEYHGPVKPVDGSADPSSSTPKEGDPLTSTPPPPGASTGKTQRQPRPRKISDEIEPPAHEIECICRCTLSVGPISFPGTEVWIGRFVEPRETRPKKERARPGERKEKRKSLAEETANRRARRARPRPSAPDSTTPRPPNGTPGSIAGPSRRLPPGAPRPNISDRPMSQSDVRPAQPSSHNSNTTVRPTASPQLIQLVNHAASRAPWLSALIYKAAGSTANQEELERLGKAVARLSRGEPIADLAPAGSVPALPASPSTQAVAGPGPSSQAGSSAPLTRTTIAPSSSQIAAPPNGQAVSKADGEDSDGEVDMSGPRQVGGGPLPTEASLHPTTRIESPAKLSGPQPELDDQTAPDPVTRPSGPLMQTPSLPSQSMPPPARPGENQVNFTSNGSNTAQTPTFNSTINPAFRPSPASAVPPLARMSTPTPPPPPKPNYQLPPPFLLVAFKEQPTEKYLIPLGSRSYISRIGGDYVTGSAPPPTPEPISMPAVKMKAEILPPPSVPTSPANAVSSVTATAPDSSIPTVNGAASVAGKATKGRTRASLGRHAKDLPLPAPPTPTEAPTAAAQAVKPIAESQPVVEPKPRERPSSGLVPLSGMRPVPGTVLISTIVSNGKWKKIDWESVGRRLPFDNPEFWMKPQDQELKTAEVKEEPTEVVHNLAPSTPTPATSVGPKRDLRHPRPKTSVIDAAQDSSTKPKPRPSGPRLLNLATEDLVPEEGSVRPLTIRLSGIEDGVWKKMKNLMYEVEKVEMETMMKNEPELLEGLEGQLQVVDTVSGAFETPSQREEQSISPNITVSPSVASPSTPTALHVKVLETLRPAYLAKKKSLFSSLLTRVTARSFLTTRLPPPPPPELVEATTDKWAPRPYPISTKPLYTVEADEEGEEGGAVHEIQLSPEPKGKKKKAGEEGEVMFEMPVSLEALDERVEEGAKKGLGRKGARGTGAAPVKRKTKRGVEKGICEGCARENIKVWRRGPTGKGTLCNACGDLYTTGKLGELKAPGAMKPFLGEDEEEEEGEEKVGAADTVEGEGEGEGKGKDEVGEVQKKEGVTDIVSGTGDQTKAVGEGQIAENVDNETTAVGSTTDGTIDEQTSIEVDGGPVGDDGKIGKASNGEPAPVQALPDGIEHEAAVEGEVGVSIAEDEAVNVDEKGVEDQMDLDP